MLKVFFDSRFFAVTSKYDECFQHTDSIVYIMQSVDMLLPMIDEFISNPQLKKLYIYTDSYNEQAIFKEINKKFTTIIAAGGLVKNHKNEILMIYRFNHWDLPKGKHENNESIEQTAIREVEEECGINELDLISPITKTYHIYNQNGSWFFKETHWFELEYKKNEALKPQLEEAIEDVKWISKNELPLYLSKVYASIKEVFKAVK